MKKAVRKQFHFQSDFPFYLVHKNTKPPQHELPDHLHDWYEIVYVYKGTGTFFIDQGFYPVKPGDLIFIPGNTIHRALPDNNDPITSTAIFFSPTILDQRSFGEPFSYTSIFESSKKTKNYIYKIEEILSRDLLHIIESLYLETINNKKDQKRAIVLWLEMLLLFLNRNCLKENTQQLSEIGLSSINHILATIEGNLENSIELNQLASMAAVSPEHFSRVFKSLLGMNVTVYITSKRMILAKELLSSTKKNINEVAERCGYHSMPHFYRTFKKYTSYTPNEYRKQSFQQGGTEFS